MGHRFIAVLSVLGLLAVGACGSSSDKAAQLQADKVERLIMFDAKANQHPESLAVDDNGDIYIGLAPLGEILKVKNGATRVSHVATVAGIAAGDFGVLGLTLDGDDVVAAVQSKAANGVWRVAKSGGTPTRIAGTETIGLPNDVVTGESGTIYVTSSTEGKDAAGANVGGVWRIADGKVDKWYTGPLLGGTGATGLPVPLGANGIAFRDDTLYVGNSEQGQVVTIPVTDDGKAGTPTVLVKDAQLNAADGITLDDAGNLFVAVIGQSQIARIDKKSHQVTLVAKDADGLDFTSSVKFGRGSRDGDLLAVNFAIAELLGGHSVEGPALLEIPKE
jgi:sugar lactone lactonase YvrE